MIRKEVELWWRQAIRDLESAKYNLQGNVCEVAAFLAHQSVEKALKALHIKELASIHKIHDLSKLARDIKAPAKIINDCATLNPVYIETRYPDYTDTIPADLYLQEEVQTFIDTAEEVLEWVNKKLKS